MRFDKLLKAWADHFNMTIKDFMHNAGYSQQAYYNYRNRPDAEPYQRTIEDFAEIYRMTPKEFMKGPSDEKIQMPDT